LQVPLDLRPQRRAPVEVEHSPPLARFHVSALVTGTEFAPRHLYEDVLPRAQVLRILEQPGPLH